MDAIAQRLEIARGICDEAAQIALDYFGHRDALLIESKGPQDVVSQADKAVEKFIWDALQRAFPDDDIHGEELGRSGQSADFTWVIDPIDGTANFVAGIPFWCVVLACVYKGEVVIGIINDPNHGNRYWAHKGHGAFLDGQAMKVSQARSIREGSVGVGYCNRMTPQSLMRFMQPLVDQGGMYYRNASGALMLAYVAAGKLIAYQEAHMNPWDCLAGLLMVEEAGGKSWPYNTEKMFSQGDAILAGARKVVEQMEPWAAFTRELEPIRL